ncbi:MAG: UDP-N-acetylglucosamine 2-epimerase (hydrolyzing) [Candidatus Marinimicrobia bacterium]|nr:UDP-N-acetylglucosamine 2-epimerase (hydrolyzing) [Candidatus Neomarinimicrobiota bacterium]MBT7515626.1 UDP-N-acetylglucosamine 2-epimerase (hydrolyzing) [Candidatus Neomarinimicrobiota bacterium]
MSKRKICVVITARPSYSRFKSALQAIKAHTELELQIVVAASALLPRYGSIIDYLEKDGFENPTLVFNVLEGGSLTSMAKTTGIGILEISTVFDNIRPDIVVTIADRFETMSTAISAAYMNIPLAHIQGGEVTGNIDEKVRHAITKLADYHFVATDDAYERVLKLGENPDFVFNTGCPSIDIAKKVMENPSLDFDPYQKYKGVGSLPDYSSGYWVVMQHPVTTEMDESRNNIEETLYAMYSIKEPVFWFWPNIDGGSDGISNGIRAFREKYDLQLFHFFKNMDPTDFLKLLANAKGIIGNSSVGIRECSFLGVPCLNIGNRQKRRTRANNLIDMPYNRENIINALNLIKNKARPRTSNLYGDGNSGKRIAEILTRLPLNIEKQIQY